MKVVRRFGKDGFTALYLLGVSKTPLLGVNLGIRSDPHTYFPLPQGGAFVHRPSGRGQGWVTEEAHPDAAKAIESAIAFSGAGIAIPVQKGGIEPEVVLRPCGVFTRAKNGWDWRHQGEVRHLSTKQAQKYLG